MAGKVIVTIHPTALDRLVHDLAFRHKGKYAVCAAGRYARPGRLELFHVSTEYSRVFQPLLGKLSKKGFDCIFVRYGNWIRHEMEIKVIAAALNQTHVRRAALLNFVPDRKDMKVYGWVKNGTKAHPIDFLNIPGPGMLKLAVHPLWPIKSKSSPSGRTQKYSGDSGHQGTNWIDTRDRLLGFMGEGDIAAGEEIIRKIANADFTITGCGRMGHSVGSHLIKFGAGRAGTLSLIDGDILEAANLDAMDVPYEAVGKPKSEVLAGMFSLLEPGLNVKAIPKNVSSAEAAEAIIRSEYNFSCFDANAPRTGVTYLTQLYDRVHFDFAAGAVYTPGLNVSVGGEACCCLPGSSPCVCCMKGGGWMEDMEELDRSDEDERNDRLSSDWRRERVGSCKAVISSVAGTGVMLFIRLLQGKLNSSIHLHFDSNALVPSWTNWTGRALNRSCGLCGSNGISGRGDLEMKYE